MSAVAHVLVLAGFTVGVVTYALVVAALRLACGAGTDDLPRTSPRQSRRSDVDS